jgi:predicted nucleotidyltransferase component of viral defense system
MNRPPNSKSNLERAISRYAGNDAVRANELAVALSNAIVAQMVGAGVVKGGSSLKLRYGDKATRVTKDLDTAWSMDLDSFLKDICAKLKLGWNGFAGGVVVLKQASPRGIPFEYVMQPCAVHLSYLGTPWRVVDMEIGHNEIGDADAFDLIPVPNEIALLTEYLCFPELGEVRAMKLEYQVAQKLHGATERGSKRAHDLIDLQLIISQEDIDMAATAAVCRELFRYRRKQPWPTSVVKNENWEAAYADQKGNLNVLPTVDEAIAWANELIASIDKA